MRMGSVLRQMSMGSGRGGGGEEREGREGRESKEEWSMNSHLSYWALHLEKHTSQKLYQQLFGDYRNCHGFHLQSSSYCHRAEV